MTATCSNDLVYPFQPPPETGHIHEVASGIYWVRMPMPFSLDHINLWLLEESDQWTIVDSGLATEEIIEAWEQLFTEHFKGKPLKRVICTHMHPDHVGLAGWLCKRDQGTLYMSRGEYTYCRTLLSDKGREAPDDAINFYHSAGLTTEQLFHYRATFGWFGKLVKPLPHSFCRLQAGNVITIGEHQWQILIGSGHSPEHICLYNTAQNILISGDQLLPTISSNISVWPMEPFANPLQEWLDSCAQLKETLDDDVLVLPAHGLPFVGAKLRLQALIDEHNEDLTALEEFCHEPRRVVDAFDILFNTSINKTNRIMATGESFAHFNYLLSHHRVSESVDEQGIKWFQRCS